MSKELVQQKVLAKWSPPPGDNEIANALINGTIISEIDDSTLWDIFKEAITACYAMSRFSPPDADELGIITTAVCSTAKYRLGSLRKEEISIAFMRGCMREYGDYKGLSAPSFIDFIKSYMRENTRVYLLQQPKEEKTIPSLEERFNTAKTNAVNAFNQYSEGKDISLVAPTAYKFLRGLGLVEYSDEEQDEFMGQAALEVKADMYQKKALTMDKFKRMEIERALEDEIGLGEKIALQARRLGLYAFFQELIMDEASLENLIEEKRKQVL